MADNLYDRSDRYGIETYRVGLFADWILMWFRLKHPDDWQLTRWDAVKRFFDSWRRAWKRKNHYNGYLAEWHYVPDEILHLKAGKGWTRKAALRKLARNLVDDNRGLDKAYHPGIRVVRGEQNGFYARWFMAPVVDHFHRPTEIWATSPKRALKRFGQQLVELNLSNAERKR